MQKTIDSFAAQQLRRDMGDAAFERWKQQNGIVDVASVSQQPAAPTGLSSLLAPVQTPGQEQMAQAGLDAMAPQPMAVQPQMEGVQKPGLFGQGGTGWQILGVLGDALQTAGGGQASYMPYRQAMNQRDEQARQALQELIAQRESKAAERDAALRDKISVIDYQRDNPAPTNASKMAQEAGLQPGTREYADFITRVATRPIMVGGEAYAPSYGGNLPQGYDPSEWEVVQ